METKILKKSRFRVDEADDSVKYEVRHISCLFPEILTMIFTFLDVRDKGRVGLVCIAWRDAAYNRLVWRGVEAKLHLRRSNPSLFPSLRRRGIKRVQILSLRRNLRDLIVDGIPTLESLSLSGCYNLTDSVLGNALSQELPSLTTLNLSLCKQITDSTLSRIASNLKYLESLDVGGCSNVSDNGILLIACGLKKLKILNLRSLRGISNKAVEHMTGISTMSVQGMPHLERLSLQDCQQLSDNSLKHIGEKMSNLKVLNLSFCTTITDAGLRFLAKMPALQELNLRVCGNISDVGIGYLSAGNLRLTSLDVSFCERVTNQSLIHISQGMFHLKSLSLGSCPIADDGLRSLAEAISNLRSRDIGQCCRVTDHGLAIIAEHLKNLESVDLYGCTKVTNVGIERLKTMPKLTKINLRI